MRRVWKLTVWLLAVGLSGWFGYVFLGVNRHTVIPGLVHRRAQPNRADLKKEFEQHHIRTVVNLRGYCPDFDWYRDEVAVCEEFGVNLENITLSAKCLPSPGEVRRIVDVIDHAERPMLIHCKEGKDRTGLVAAMVRLLTTDDTLAQARRELWPIWGHFRVARTQAMDEFFDRYEAWLAGKPHTKELFRDWATNVYIAGVGRSRMTVLSSPGDVIKRGDAPKWVVRVTNTSADPWRLRPGSTAAVHLGYVLSREGEKQSLLTDKAGLLHRTVAVGESIDLAVPLPPLREPGRFVLKLEMQDYTGAGIDDRATPFTKYGDEPLVIVFEVR